MQPRIKNQLFTSCACNPGSVFNLKKIKTVVTRKLLLINCPKFAYDLHLKTNPVIIRISKGKTQVRIVSDIGTQCPFKIQNITRIFTTDGINKSLGHHKLLC